MTSAAIPGLHRLWTPARRLASGAGLTALIGLLALVTAVDPVLGLLCVPALVIAAVAVGHPRKTAMAAAPAVLLAVALVTALRPALAALAAPAIALGSAALAYRYAVARVAVVAVVAAAVAALALGVAAWPVTMSLIAIVVAVIALAVDRPGLALAAAILLFGFEGSIKILLGLEPSPLPGGSRAAGAAAIDLALFATVAAIVVADRGRTPRALWARARGWERVVLALLATWLAVSVLQVAQGGDLVRGLEGFRLFQAYAAVVIAAAVVAARAGAAARAPAALLTIGLAVGLYATLRVVVGPAVAEEQFTLSIETTTAYGQAVRAVGSFSSSVGLVSFVTPIAVFALVIGLLQPARRGAAWTVAALGIAALVGSYARAPLVAIVVALAIVLAMLGAAADVPRRRKLQAIAAVGVFVIGAYGSVFVASRADPELRERAQGIVEPWNDESIGDRLETWRQTLADVAREPLGRGVGTVGGASAEERRYLVTTDNSVLKVLLEQGIPVGALFVAGLLGTLALVAGRLRRCNAERRAVGLAAFAGFIAFLVLAVTGEYVEQPGKVVAWWLLGLAVTLALEVEAGK